MHTLESLLTLTLIGTFILSASGVERETPTQSTTEVTALVDALRQMLDTEPKGFRICPPPYTHILGECFYIHMYIPLLTWKEAQTFCGQAGGILAEPQYFGAIIAHIYNTGMAEKVFRGIFNRLWLGGQRVSSNSTSFKWASSGHPINDPVIEEDNPIYSDGSGDCVMMTMYKDGPFQLRAKDCDITTHYVCQLP